MSQDARVEGRGEVTQIGRDHITHHYHYGRRAAAPRVTRMDPMDNVTTLRATQELTLRAALDRNVRERPDKMAVAVAEHSLTYAGLRRRADAVAALLTGAGVQAGDNVALLMTNRLEFTESLFACQLLGAVPVPINFRLVADEVRHILTDAEVVGVLTDGDCALTAGQDSMTSVMGSAWHFRLT